MLSTIITLIVFGIILLGIEFIIPGGVVGVLGIVALIGATVLAFAEFGTGPGLATAIGVILLVVVFIAVWVKYFHRTIVGKKLTLASEIGGRDLYEENAKLLGRKGVAASDLRPSGKAIIDGRKIDVVAEVGLIEKDKPVVVVEVKGVRIVVAEADR